MALETIIDEIDGTKVFQIQETFVKQVQENEEKFIIDTISPYLTKCYKQVIPKRLLIRALTTFHEEHREEWDWLMAQAQEDV